MSVIEAMIDRLLALESTVLWAGLATWLALSFAVGAMAMGKGHSGGGYFLMGLLLSPVIGALVVLLLDDRKAKAISDLNRRLVALEPAPPANDDDGNQPPATSEVPRSAMQVAFLILVVALGLWVFVLWFGQSARH